MHIPQVMGGVYPHVQMLPLFRVSEMAGRIALKSDGWFEAH